MKTVKGELPGRGELDPRFTWRLEDIYATVDDWEREYSDVQELAQQVARYRGRLAESVETLKKVLDLRTEIGKRVSRVYSYASLKSDEDTTQADCQVLAERVQSLASHVDEHLSYIEPELLALPDERLNELVRAQELSLYGHYFDQLLRQRSHVRNDEVEAVLAAAGEVLEAPSSIYQLLTNADFRFPTIEDENGEPIEITKGRFIRLQRSHDRRVRRESFEGLYQTYEKHRHALAAALNAAVKSNVFQARMRLYNSALEASLDRYNVPPVVYDQLIDTVHANMDSLHRYLELRKQVLGVDAVHMYDIYVPLVESVSLEYTFEEARQIVLEALAPLGEDYRTRLERAFDERWIDVFENRGKRSGAYSNGSAWGVHPYVLMNWDGTLDSVYTLAHELGHSMHSVYTNESQPYIYSHYPIFLAEVASTVNEGLLTQYLLGKLSGHEERSYLLNSELEKFRGTLIRQTLFAEFERDIYHQLEGGQPLTADSLCKRYVELKGEYYGSDAVLDAPIAMEWSRIDHFYYNFYVYMYATGVSAATALVSHILDEGEPAVKRYLGFLKAGASDYPLPILQRAGVDMASSTPVQEAFGQFNRLLKEFKAAL